MFGTDILDIARTQRPRLVAAALTVLRAWHVADARVELSPFGSFDAWSHRVREPLVWLGRADPCETVAKVREDDPMRSALLTVLLQWKEALGIGSAHPMREIINVAISRSDFFNALLAVAANRSGNVISNERFGRWLKANEGKITNGFSIVRAGSVDGYPLWRLTKV
jgi:putative DNA primase/helicase